jgi:polysaccharide export outer membrane protein
MVFTTQLRLWVCLFSCLLGGSIVASTALTGFIPPTDVSPTASVGRIDYLLQPSDLLHVQVFQEDDLQRDVRISQEYTITLALIGSVNLQGTTLREAEILIRNSYAENYLVKPQVTVSVLEYTKRSVNVLGSVGQPGSVLFTPEQPMTLLDAIARAGGFSRLADRQHVSLSRTVDGQVEKYTINADEVIQGNTTQAWVLRKDDVIYVPEKLF